MSIEKTFVVVDDDCCSCAKTMVIVSVYYPNLDHICLLNDLPNLPETEACNLFEPSTSLKPSSNKWLR